MKQILLLATLLLANGNTRAQSPEMTVHLQGGERVTLSTDQIRSLVFSELTAVEEPAEDRGFVLHPAWPNPFNPATTLEFDLPARAEVSVRILDLRGAEVIRLARGPLEAGRHRLEWDGRNARGLPVASGLYLCSASRGATTRTTKLILLK